MLDNVFNLTKILVLLLRENARTRNVFSVVLPIITVIALFILLFSPYELKPAVEAVIKVLIGLSSFLFVVTLASFTNLQFDKDILVDSLLNIKEERERLKEKIANNDNVINTIQLSLNQLNEYYTINLSQARSSYRWSIVAIIVGLITLVSSVWLLFFQVNPNITMVVITGISGVLIEFIGASNIYVYNKSIVQLNIYFNQLINIQDTMLAIELTANIDDGSRKTDITEKIIMNLINRNVKMEAG